MKVLDLSKTRHDNADIREDDFDISNQISVKSNI